MSTIMVPPAKFAADYTEDRPTVPMPRRCPARAFCAARAEATNHQHNFVGAQAMAEVFVAKVADFPDGDRKIVQHGTHDIGVFHWEGQFYAYSNLCLHQGGPACEGLLMHQVEDVIGPDKTWVGQKFSDQQINFVCPWHGYEYDLKTGECVPDRKLRLKKYNVVRKGDEVFVSI
jgi:nitrite reductase/ring-hydroxylating ferredoxin subunit